MKPRRKNPKKASASATRRELLGAAMQKIRSEPAKGKSSRPSTNGNHSGNGATVFDFPNDELEAAIQRFVELYDFAPIAHVGLDRAGRIEEANFAAARLLGRNRDALAGTPFSLHVYKPDADIFLRHLLHCRSSEGGSEIELRLKDRAGKIIPVLLSSVPTDSSEQDGALLYQTAIIDLTERKQAEDAVRESEQRYRNLFEWVPVAVYTTDAKGLILEFNQRAARLWGREPRTNDPKEKFCGSFRMFYPDGRPMPHKDCPMARVLRGEKILASECEILVERKDGMRRNVAASPLALRDKRGKIVGAINCVFDITESKDYERSLAEVARQQNVLYQFVQERHGARSVDDIYAAGLEAVLSALQCDRASILLFDEGGVVRFVAWHGLSTNYRQAIEGHSPWKAGVKNARPIAIGDIDRAKFPKALKATIRREGIRAAAFIPLIADDKLIGKVMVYYNTPHDFSAQEIDLAFNIASQVALGIERKRAEEALHESEEFHRALVRQTTVAMARTNLKGRLEFVNANYCEMLGYKEVELLGKTIQEITHPDDATEGRKLFQRLVRQGRPYQQEKRYLRKDGSILWANVSAAPMRDAKGSAESAVAVIVDISERKKAQAAVENSKNVLEQRVIERTAELTAVNEELQSQIDLRKRLESEILGISDREQRRLGQDLHDSLCQHLTATAFMTQAVARRLKDHRVVEVSDLEKIADLINNGVTEARTIAKGLHPVEMDSAGLANALRTLLQQHAKVPYVMDIDDEIEITDPTVSLHLFRIAREAIVNANKHAQASEIVVRLRTLPKFIELSVTDDGVGPPRKFVEGPGMGFHIMEYRARSIGALLEIVAVKPHGTRVACYLSRK
jgi:PAS domain S-box-containing protein